MQPATRLERAGKGYSTVNWLVAIHLSPPQSRHCDRVRCLKIPHEGLCLLYGFVLECGDKECLHTVGLAQGSFISRINDSFFVDLHHKAK